VTAPVRRRATGAAPGACGAPHQSEGRNVNILGPVRRYAAESPDAVAIVFPGGTLTRAGLVHRIGACMRHLRAYGLGAGDLVGLTVEHPIDHLVAALALAGIGAAHVALPAGDPPAVRRQVRDRLGVHVLVTDAPLREADDVREIAVATSTDAVGAGPVAVAAAMCPAGGLADVDEPLSSDGALAWLLIRSSGTTGEPKFAGLSHATSLERHARYADAYGYRQGDVFWIGIDVGTITGKQHVLSALQAGVAVCLPIGLASYPELLRFLRASGVTLAYDIPSHLWNLVRSADVHPCLPGVRRFYVGTTDTPDALKRAFRENVCPNLYVNYGTNEAPCVTIASPAVWTRVPGAVGVAHPSVELQVVDDRGAPLAPGVTGEIRMRGPGIVPAYYRDPVATARAFSDGWFRPGDLGFLTGDGELVLQGRTDDMMIFDGVNIHPAEIERVVSTHPQIREVAAFGVPHPRFGQVPAMAVVPSSSLDERALAQWCAARLGAKCPQWIVVAEALPRNASGKVMRREMVARFGATHRG